MSGEKSIRRLVEGQTLARASRRGQLGGLVALSISAMLCGCQGPGYGTPDWNWAPGSGARIAPPETGRGAYGSPDPYYQNSPAPNKSSARDRDDDRFYSRVDNEDGSVAPAEYVDRGPWKQGGRQQGDSLQLKGGMPKSGEPRRLRVQDDLTELTDLPSRNRFGSRTARAGATLMSPNSRSRRTPYREDYARDVDEDYKRGVSTADARWRKRN